MTTNDVSYRPCAGVVLFRPDGLVWVAKRTPKTPRSIEPSRGWQFPQGGLEPQESPINAALRELHEETGVSPNSVRLLDEHPKWLLYKLPDSIPKNGWAARYRGQSQKWFAFRFLGNDREFQLDAHHSPEFVEWKWIPLHTTPQLVVDFKQPVYEQIVKRFAPLAVPS